MARLVHPPKRRSKNPPRIIHVMEQEYSPSAALSLDPEGPKVLFRISSLGPYELAIGPWRHDRGRSWRSLPMPSNISRLTGDGALDPLRCEPSSLLHRTPNP